MILTCPSCDTRYFADLSALGGRGRSVRCASCGHVWKAKARETEPKPPPDKDPEPDPLPEIEDASDDRLTPKRRAPPLRLSFLKHPLTKALAPWLGAAALLIATITTAYMLRIEIVRIWPKTASAYAAFGVTATASGLVLENVGAARSVIDGESALTVTADLRNPTGSMRAAPFVRIRFLDADGHEMRVHDAPPPIAQLPPGVSAPFSALVLDPPIDAVNMEVMFVAAPVRADEAETDHR